MNSKRQAGASLIEVLITALIMAVGLLGLAALQSRSLQYNHAAALRSQANVLASDIIDRMRINQVVALAGGYDTAYGQAQSTGSTLVAKDLSEWKTLLANALPSGDGAVTCATNTTCTISIRWRERRATEDQNVLDSATTAAEQESSQFTYTTRL